jgi:hypothetical protein
MMRKPMLILLIGVVLAATAFCGVYFAGTHDCRQMSRADVPELYWLRKEFRLSDAEFKRISELHRNYLPGCKEMCNRIEEKNSGLQKLLASQSSVSPDVVKALNEVAQLRVECQARMLSHFYDVAKTMPPEQGKRYLEWVQRNTLLPDYGMAK